MMMIDSLKENHLWDYLSYVVNYSCFVIKHFFCLKERMTNYGDSDLSIWQTFSRKIKYARHVKEQN